MNDDLAYQALDYIREHPEEWDQRYYFCGTAACFAGRVLLLDSENHGQMLMTGHVAVADPDREAAAKLGWDYEDATSVFHCGTKDFSELERLVKNVLNGEVQDSDKIPWTVGLR